MRHHLKLHIIENLGLLTGMFLRHPTCCNRDRAERRLVIALLVGQARPMTWQIQSVLTQ
jgi:hypothetical protein